MQVGTMLLVVAVGVGMAPAAHGGGKFWHRASGPQPDRMVTPNGSVVPAWAARRIENSTVPLFAPTTGRRPWAVALANEATPAARWARASQLGIGAGPVPGYTNGPPLGNYPQAAVGPTDTAASLHRGGFGWPFNVYLNGN